MTITRSAALRKPDRWNGRLASRSADWMYTAPTAGAAHG